ncbi:chemoreceptor glutamine deamidase CheD [Nitrospira defluvii]|nr:chemoreceptor glutamine deamidase CheD [Nitrospira defluvii]
MNRDNGTFPHVRRFFDGRFPYEIAQILPGEYFVSNTPKVIYTILGSCISACVMDPVLKIGGMNHFMLPAPRDSSTHDSWRESARYGSYAMEMLINEIMKRGGDRDRLEVKLFGGGKLYKSMSDVGLNNADWTFKYLEIEGLKLVMSDVGDVYPRKVYYFTDSGRVLIKKIKHVKNSTIFDREQTYKESLKQKSHPGEAACDVTLF